MVEGGDESDRNNNRYNELEQSGQVGETCHVVIKWENMVNSTQGNLERVSSLDMCVVVIRESTR